MKNDPINPEDTAYWYFRLNGCLTMVNFVAHPHNRGSAKIEADIIAVRFPYRVELEDSNLGKMKDDSIFDQLEDDKKIDLFLVEVKTGNGAFNQSWTHRQEPLERILKAMGWFKSGNVSRIVKTLQNSGKFETKTHRLRVCVVANRYPIQLDIPSGQQLSWRENVLPFIYCRMREYHNQKKISSTVGQYWEEALRFSYID